MSHVEILDAEEITESEIKQLSPEWQETIAIYHQNERKKCARMKEEGLEDVAPIIQATAPEFTKLTENFGKVWAYADAIPQPEESIQNATFAKLSKAKSIEFQATFDNGESVCFRLSGNAAAIFCQTFTIHSEGSHKDEETEQQTHNLAIKANRCCIMLQCDKMEPIIGE